MTSILPTAGPVQQSSSDANSNDGISKAVDSKPSDPDSQSESRVESVIHKASVASNSCDKEPNSRPQKLRSSAKKNSETKKLKQRNGKIKPVVVDDPDDEWDDWDSHISSSTTSRASSIKSVDIDPGNSLNRKPVQPAVKKPINVKDDDADGDWDEW